MEKKEKIKRQTTNPGTRIENEMHPDDRREKKGETQVEVKVERKRGIGVRAEIGIGGTEVEVEITVEETEKKDVNWVVT